VRAIDARLIAGLALACWLAAWFLPVLDGYTGWDAFIAALQGPFRPRFPTHGEHAIAQILSALTNVGFVLLFIHWARTRITRPSLFLRLALLCLLINCYWLVEMLRAGEGPGLLVGYYLWLAAFALLVALGAVSVVSARRTSRTPTAGTPA
jgi:hypothetical protein